MTGTALAGYVVVPVFGVLLCIAPTITRPTLQFGVRIPPARAGAAVIQRAKRSYAWQSADNLVDKLLSSFALGDERDAVKH